MSRCRHDPEQSRLLGVSSLSTHHVWAHNGGKADVALLGALTFGGHGNKSDSNVGGVAQEMGFVPWRNKVG